MPGVSTADQVRFEDLSSAEAVLDMREVPFFTALREGKKLERHDLFSEAVGSMGKRRRPGAPEREDVKGYEGDKTNKLYARSTRFERTPSVSTETELSNNSADKTTKDYNAQVTKKIQEEIRDIDYYLLSDAESQEDDGVRGYFGRAVGRWVNDGTSGAATAQPAPDGEPWNANSGTASLAFGDTPTAIPSSLRTPAAQIYTGTTANFLEADMNTAMASRARHAGKPMMFTLYTGLLLKSQISENFGRYVPNKAGFDTIVTTSRADIDKKKLVIAGIDVLEGDWGTFTVEWEPWMPTEARGYGMDMSACEKRKLCYLRHKEHEDKGGGRRGLIDSILAGWFGDPRKHFKVAPSDEFAATVDFEQ